MSLKTKLDMLREQFEATAPPEAMSVMHQATKDLLASDIMDGVLKTGDRAPDFSLNDQDNNLVSTSALLLRGPLVISFYRGVW